MFNHARFNLQRYNLAAGTEEVVRIREELFEAYDGIFGVGEDVHVINNLNESYHYDVQLAAAEFAEALLLENYDAAVAFVQDYFYSAALAENYGADTEIGLDSYIAGELSEEVRQQVILGTLTYIVADLLEKFEGSAGIGADYLLPLAALGEYFSFSGSATPIATTDIFIEAEIPPGGVLVIDSDNYVVLLDGEDVTWTQSGGWAQLSPTTIDLSVEAATGGDMNVSALFTEAYL